MLGGLGHCSFLLPCLLNLRSIHRYLPGPIWCERLLTDCLLSFTFFFFCKPDALVIALSFAPFLSSLFRFLWALHSASWPRAPPAPTVPENVHSFPPRPAGQTIPSCALWMDSLTFPIFVSSSLIHSAFRTPTLHGKPAPYHLRWASRAACATK